MRNKSEKVVLLPFQTASSFIEISYSHSGLLSVTVNPKSRLTHIGKIAAENTSCCFSSLNFLHFFFFQEEYWSVS